MQYGHTSSDHPFLIFMGTLIAPTVTALLVAHVLKMVGGYQMPVEDLFRILIGVIGLFSFLYAGYAGSHVVSGSRATYEENFENRRHWVFSSLVTIGSLIGFACSFNW